MPQGRGGELLSVCHSVFRFQMARISRSPEALTASQEGLLSIKCVQNFEATLIECHSYLPEYNTTCDSHTCCESLIGWYGYRVLSVSGMH